MQTLNYESENVYSNGQPQVQYGGSFVVASSKKIAQKKVSNTVLISHGGMKTTQNRENSAFSDKGGSSILKLKSRNRCGGEGISSN